MARKDKLWYCKAIKDAGTEAEAIRLLDDYAYSIPDFKKLRESRTCGTCKRFSQSYCEDTSWSMNKDEPIESRCAAEYQVASKGWEPITWDYVLDETNYLPPEQTNAYEIERLMEGWAEAECEKRQEETNGRREACFPVCQHERKHGDYCSHVMKAILPWIDREGGTIVDEEDVQDRLENIGLRMKAAEKEIGFLHSEIDRAAAGWADEGRGLR